LPTLALLETELADKRTTDVTARWADQWVRDLKLERNLSPGSIRKRVGSLARVLDWWIRTTLKDGDTAPANPLRMMPRSYSQYAANETAALKSKGLAPKHDVQRNRRLAPGEELRIRAALAGERRADRQRALPVDPDFALLFDLILNTGIRLREAFKLRVEQYDAGKGVLHVEGTKGERGRIKPRIVPIAPSLREVLRDRCKDRIGLMFPFWDGSPESLDRASQRLSHRFASLFSYALVDDFTEHDLRHEATCRWVTMRDKSGRWMWSEIEVARIMGWSDTRMMLRYASLRGEDLADRMLG